MDGMILPRTQLEQGVTEPPFHPNCRCTTVPYDEDWDYKGQRIAKDKDGKYYYVPETMSYEEWKREYVDQKLKGLNTDKQAGKTRLKVDIQALAKESDLNKQKSSSIKHSIRKLQEQINTHRDKIAHPETYAENWNTFSKEYQNGLMKHWNKEIQKFEESISRRIEVLKERGDYNE